MNSKQNIQLTNDYKSRINKVFDYIEANFNKQFRLDELAEIANFSKYHFNRIFWAMVGERPFQFITRLKLEKAATYLKSDSNVTISDVAFKCGFNDLSVFSRNFKLFFKYSPTEWRNQDSNFSQMKRSESQNDDEISLYFCNEFKTLKWRSNMELNQTVEVKTLPKITVAYVRHTGHYKGDSKVFENLFNKIFAWAGAKGLMEQPDLKVLAVYHDDPDLTEDEKLRTSVCISVPEDTKVEGEVGKMEIKGGKYAVGRFKVSSQQFEQAWGWLMGTWLPQSSYVPDDGVCFESYPKQEKSEIFTVDICVPVKPV